MLSKSELHWIMDVLFFFLFWDIWYVFIFYLLTYIFKDFKLYVSQVSIDTQMLLVYILL